ncbi:MAG: UDP-glucose 4-epimerase [Verrucomicrobiae bacterium]|nr:UDP-glucose 4-epimerase [Verrucomicrobiae bacterium]
MKTVYVTGGAGYVGAVLVPKLLAAGYRVRVLDLFIYGDVLPRHDQLEQIKGDLRDQKLLQKTIPGSDAVIHLACISNDPSFELNPALGKAINLDAFEPLVQISKAAGVQRFIYASSSSVYGVKHEPNVTEDLPLEPLTDYSRFKMLCEEILAKYYSPDWTCCTIRPATVCGYSPRLRLDLTVNILTNHAINKGKITVFGGNQLRPNLHIEDMTDLYLRLLEAPAEKIDRKIWNAGYHNLKVSAIAELVQQVIGPKIEIVTEPTNDNRSYQVNSEKIAREFGFKPKHTVKDAIRDLKTAFEAGKIPDSLTDPRYFNIKMMQGLNVH